MTETYKGFKIEGVAKGKADWYLYTDLCKGCGLCVANCPQHVIEFTNQFNELGYKYAAYKGDGCIGCGVCFYSCPEPGAITVFKKPKGA